MAASVPGSDSPVQEPFTFPNDWDDPFAQWTGDEFPSLFGDLPDGTDLNVGDAPSNLFDDFPIGPDLDVGVGPSNLFDDYVNGADVTLGVGPLTLLDDFPIGVDVNVHGELSNLIDGFPMGLDVNVHDGSVFSANYQGALTYDIGTLSLPTAADPDLLPRMGCTNDHVLQLSDLESAGPTVPQDQLAWFMNVEPQPSWSTQTDGTTLSPFEYGTIIGLQTDVCNDLAMPGNCENAADVFAPPNSWTVAASNTIFDPSHADSTDDHFTQSAGLTGLTSQTSLFDCNTIRSDQDPLLENPMGTISALEDTRSTQELALKDNAFGSDEKARHQPHLGWISYDQSSFTDSTTAPRPVQTCSLPGNRKRGRREPLTETKRKKIAEMRQLKSCLLCRMKKKDCDNGTPCKRCLHAARSRPSLLPCLRAPLADLTAAFVPPVLFFYSKVEDASSRMPCWGPNSRILMHSRSIFALPALWHVWLVLARHSKQEPATSSFLSRLSGARGIYNIWAESVVEDTESFRRRTPLRKRNVIGVIQQIYINRARPSVIKDALKILLLTYLFGDLKDRKYHELIDQSCGELLGYNGITFQTCIGSLIERILGDLLTRLQTLLLHRREADWTVVVSVMTALSMTANMWIPIDSCQYLEGRLSNIENGWNVILSLYAAAYSGKRLFRGISANKSSISQSEEIALRLVDELNTWIEKDGDAYPESRAEKFRVYMTHPFKCVARLISDEDGQGKHPATS